MKVDTSVMKLRQNIQSELWIYFLNAEEIYLYYIVLMCRKRCDTKTAETQ